MAKEMVVLIGRQLIIDSKFNMWIHALAKIKPNSSLTKNSTCEQHALINM